ncbi:hypothetical protein GGR51DRAFT_573393 [Nemania sp. FL0031]|nr:hypothetical protein GGR51DRAFT_573393 [Nemania sp. FL0031]
MAPSELSPRALSAWVNCTRPMLGMEEAYRIVTAIPLQGYGTESDATDATSGTSVDASSQCTGYEEEEVDPTEAGESEVTGEEDTEMAETESGSEAETVMGVEVEVTHLDNSEREPTPAYRYTYTFAHSPNSHPASAASTPRYTASLPVYNPPGARAYTNSSTQTYDLDSPNPGSAIPRPNQGNAIVTASQGNAIPRASQDNATPAPALFTCRHCGSSSCQTKSALEQHIKDRHIGTWCYWPGCGFTTNAESGLIKHFIEHQRQAIGAGVAREKCPWPNCPKTYSRQDTVQRCIKRHNREAPRGI